jgi:hypothetical protein
LLFHQLSKFNDEEWHLNSIKNIEEVLIFEQWPMGTSLVGASLSFHDHPTNAACGSPLGY